MPDISMVVSLAKTLNVSTDYLFGLEKNEIDDNVYVELKRHIEKIETESGRKAEAALLSCQFMLKKVYEAPDNYIYSVFFVEQVANLSRFVDLEKYAEDKWAEYRELAIKYGSNAIRFANNKEWIERAHFALAWIYIHDRNYAYAREHIEQLPSVSSNRLQESILAQLEAFENGIDAMDEAVTKNLQNFVRAINKENLYAMETFSWQKPLRAVEFGQWAIRLIEVFGENKYLKSYCRGFLRDIYKYLINAEVILGRFENAAKYFEELKEQMQKRLGITVDKEKSRLTDYKQEILQHAAVCRTGYQKYIAQFPVKNGDIAFFDFVAKGTCQLFMSRIVDAHLKGFYFLRLEEEQMKDRNLDIVSFYESSERDNSVIFDDYYILETMLTSPMPSVAFFDEEGSPVYVEETRSLSDIECFQKAQSGILDYFKIYTKICPNRCLTENKKLDEVLLSLIHKISIEDETFLKLKVEDAFFNRMTEMPSLI